MFVKTFLSHKKEKKSGTHQRTHSRTHARTQPSIYPSRVWQVVTTSRSLWCGMMLSAPSHQRVHACTHAHTRMCMRARSHGRMHARTLACIRARTGCRQLMLARLRPCKWRRGYTAHTRHTCGLRTRVRTHVHTYAHTGGVRDIDEDDGPGRRLVHMLGQAHTRRRVCIYARARTHARTHARSTHAGMWWGVCS